MTDPRDDALRLAREEADTPTDAARAQALEEAVECVMAARMGEADSDLRSIIHAIRALSPLPPGSRVVVIPPEGSAEWDAMVDLIWKRTISHLSHRENIRAALRALTGGDDRG